MALQERPGHGQREHAGLEMEPTIVPARAVASAIMGSETLISFKVYSKKDLEAGFSLGLD